MDNISSQTYELRITIEVVKGSDQYKTHLAGSKDTPALMAVNSLEKHSQDLMHSMKAAAQKRFPDGVPVPDAAKEYLLSLKLQDLT